MSYDLAVWVGDMPASDSAAADKLEELLPLIEDSAGLEPDPGLIRFADALLARFPEISEEAGKESPWAVSPLTGDLVGPFFYLPLNFRATQDTISFIVDRARAHRLVCFDPQTERLLTPSAKRRLNPFRGR